MRKYEVPNQITGVSEEVATFEEAVALRAQLRDQFIADRVDPLYIITVLVQNEDGTWSQSLADENGEPILE